MCLTSLVELAIHVDIGMDEYYTLVTNSKINILEVDPVTELEFLSRGAARERWVTRL